MALFKFRSAGPFRVRSRQRDGEADAARLAKLFAFLDDFHATIAKEHEGLRARHATATERAAFSQQSLEDDQPDPGLSSTVDQLTGAMMRYDTRLKALERQMAFVTEMRAAADRFPLETEAVREDEHFAGGRHINPHS